MEWGVVQSRVVYCIPCRRGQPKTLQGSAREGSIEGGQCKANSKYYRKGSAREGSIEGGQCKENPIEGRQCKAVQERLVL